MTVGVRGVERSASSREAPGSVRECFCGGPKPGNSGEVEISLGGFDQEAFRMRGESNQIHGLFRDVRLICLSLWSIR